MDEDQTFDAAAKRRYAGGILHAVIYGASKSGNLMHVEAHHEGTTPTGDLIVRFPIIGGAYRLRLEPYEEESSF